MPFLPLDEEFKKNLSVISMPFAAKKLTKPGGRRRRRKFSSIFPPTPLIVNTISTISQVFCLYRSVHS